MTYPTILNVIPIKDYILIVEFSNGERKKFDAKILIESDKYMFNSKKVFKDLLNIDLFNIANIDIGGYAIIWNDEIDIASEYVYDNSEIM